MKPVVVLGTGMAGFGAAHALDEAGTPFIMFDHTTYVGGHTRSFRYPGGYVFDEGGHISFTKDERIRDLLARQVAGRYEELQLRIDNYWHGHRIRHPVQCNLRGLPPDLVVDVIRDFVAVTEAPLGEEKTYAEWLVQAYGRTFAETFPMPYGEKYHTVSMDQLTTDWIGPRMYRPTLDEIVFGALAGQRDNVHYVDAFRYPTSGGFMSYLEPFAERFDVRLDHGLTRIDWREHTLTFARGEEVAYDEVISSIPLPEVVPLLVDVPQTVREASDALAFTTAVAINIALDRPSISDTHITYFYDNDIVFSRVNLPHMFSAANAPDGVGLIQAEVYFSDKYKPLVGLGSDLVEPVVSDLRRTGFIEESDTILLQDPVVLRYANVIYDHDRNSALRIVHEFLDEIGVRYCGRYGDWDHAWTDEAFLSGESVALGIRQPA